MAELIRADVETLFYFGPSQNLASFSAGAAEANWSPHIFLSGVLSGGAAFDLPPTFNERVFLAYPTIPADQTPSGVEAFMNLHKKHGLSREHLATQVAVYVAAKVLVEGLRRSGQALSRVNLVAALENFSDFETGLTQPVSFGSNRRIGALGAHVVSVDLKRKSFGSGGRWMRLD